MIGWVDRDRGGPKCVPLLRRPRGAPRRPPGPRRLVDPPLRGARFLAAAFFADARFAGAAFLGAEVFGALARFRIGGGFGRLFDELVVAVMGMTK